MGRLGSGAMMALVALWGCEADITTECVGGSCSGVPEEQVTTTSTTSSEGGGGGGPVCFEGCDPESVSGNTGEYPCAVDKIVDNCRRCHVDPPMGGAPFSLDGYEGSQQLYGKKAIWFRMKSVIDSDFMPLKDPKLTPAEKVVLIDEWACKCAPPRAPGEVCE